jgi:hypothetical protein
MDIGNIFLPPSNIAKRSRSKKSVFLAGSIEMGKAEDWQRRMSEMLVSKDFNVFNPRRKDWDSSWVQTYKNPQFAQQVRWELNALDKADYIIMYLDPNTISPISLLELGLLAHCRKMIVICPDGFFRKGNVEVVCDIYDLPLLDSLDHLIDSHYFDNSSRGLWYRGKFFFKRLLRKIKGEIF